jgi:hypothetical protein
MGKDSGYASQTQQKNIAWFLPRPDKSKYKGGMPLYCEDWLVALAKDILQKQTIDLCSLFCGMCKFGFRIDINPDVSPDLLADAHSFSQLLNGRTFDVILADPPYSDEEALQLYNQHQHLTYRKWTAECDKVLKEGGLLIVYHKLIKPNPDPTKYKVVKRVFIGTRQNHQPRVAVYFQKQQKDEKKSDQQLSENINEDCNWE